MTGRPTLATLLRGRSRAALTEFVTALYRARGAETTRTDDRLVVDGERVLILASGRHALEQRLREHTLGHAHGEAGEAVDRVIAVDERVAARVAERYGARAVSAADLDRLARYGLDRERADALYRSTFGRPVSAVEPLSTTPGGGRTERSQPRSVALLVVGVVGVALLVGAMSGAGATTASFPWGDAPPETVSVSTPAVQTPASEASTSERPTTGAPTKAPSLIPAETNRFAPGVTWNGISDIDTLASAHAAALGSEPYRWELTYVETMDGVTTARGRETVRVASPERFVSDVEWDGSPTGFAPVAVQPSYADGAERHRPGENGTLVSYQLLEIPPAGEQGWRASRYVQWYLSGEPSTLERTLIHTDEETAVVVVDGSDHPTVERYTARAHVTREGFVRSLSVSYVLSDGGATGANETQPSDHARGSTEGRVSVQFTFRYVETNASASPPAWYLTD